MHRKTMLLLGVCLLVITAGCGTANKNSSTNSDPSNQSGPTFAAGQWEFAFGDPSSPSMYVESTFAPAGTTFSSTNNTFLFVSQFDAPVYGGAIGAGLCSGLTLYVQNSETSFSGNFVESGGIEVYSVTGTLSANGQSISNGTFATEVSGANLVVCSQSAPSTFTAYVVPPISGTFTGTLDASNGVQDQASIQLSENANMQVTGTGTVSGNGVITTVTIPGPAATTPVTIQGALINGNGSATNANGTDSFYFVAHCNATCSQIYVRTYDGHTGISETGTLSKQ